MTTKTSIDPAVAHQNVLPRLFTVNDTHFIWATHYILEPTYKAELASLPKEHLEASVATLKINSEYEGVLELRTQPSRDILYSLPIEGRDFYPDQKSKVGAQNRLIFNVGASRPYNRPLEIDNNSGF